jgi:hypothetical protein
MKPGRDANFCLPLMWKRLPAIAKPLGRHAFRLHEDRVLMLPAQIPSSFSNAMLCAHRKIA